MNGVQKTRGTSRLIVRQTDNRIQRFHDLDAHDSPIHLLPRSQANRVLEGHLRRDRVLHRDAHGLEERDLVVVGSACLPAEHQLTEFRMDVIATDESGIERLNQIARLFPRCFATVNNDQRSLHRFGRNLASLRRVRADGIDVNSRLEMSILEDRLLRSRRATNDVRLLQRLLRRSCAR